MYSILRKIHLYTAMILLCFVVMYFVSGYPMIHEDLLPNPDPDRTTRTESLHRAGDMEPEAFSAHLQQEFDLRGKRLEPKHLRDGGWKFRYFRPGTEHEAVVDADGNRVRITREEEHFRRTLIGFHRLHGYGGGWLYTLWAILYDLASLSLIVFALTGIYMWYKLTSKRLLGWILLGLNFSYATATVLYLIYAP